MKGLGTDDKVLSRIVTERTRDQLLEIKACFQKKHGKTLDSWIKDETSGHYETICISLIQTRPDFDAQLVNRAVKGLGTDDDELIETLCTRNNDEIKAMKASYVKLYGKDMEKDVGGDTSGDYKRLLLEILRAERVESPTVNVEEAKKDAMALYQAGEGKMGTDEKVFIDILSKRSFPHLHVVNQEYSRTSGHSLEKGISKEMSGNLGKALKVILTPRPEYFAEAIRDAVAGAGTNDKKLIRILAYISNSKEMTRAVNDYYTHRYKNNLAKDVGGDTSGWYGKTCVALVQNRLL